MSNDVNGLLNLTRDAVGRVARALITLNGKTTTLEVKTKLRELGFLANQDDVRYYMLDITSVDGDLVYDNDYMHQYRIYKFRVPFPDVDMMSHTSRQHFLDASGICVDCGLSSGAIDHFKWMECDGKMTEIGVPEWLRAVTIPLHGTQLGNFGGTNPTVTNKPQQINTNTVKLHRDDIPDTYTVHGGFGRDARTYHNVSRSEAKQLWAKETGNHYFQAHTQKHG